VIPYPTRKEEEVNLNRYWGGESCSASHQPNRERTKVRKENKTRIRWKNQRKFQIDPDTGAGEGDNMGNKRRDRGWRTRGKPVILKGEGIEKKKTWKKGIKRGEERRRDEVTR